MKGSWLVSLFILLTGLLLLAGCAQMIPSSAPRAGSITGEAIDKAAAGEERPFVFTIDQKMVDSNSQIRIQGSGKVEKGWTRVILYGPDGQEVYRNGDFGGEYSFNGFYKPVQAGDYRVATAWEAGTAARFDLSYQAGEISGWVMLPGLGMLLVGIGFVVYSLRRGGTWAYLGLGALAWIVTVAIKFAIAIPLNTPINNLLYTPNTLWTPGDVLMYVYVGALTGATEVLLTWFLLRYTRLGRVPWRKALAFGIGFGAVEAILLSLSPLYSGYLALFAPKAIPGSAMYAVFQMNQPIIGLAPVVERFATILVHVLCNVLLFYGVFTGKARWMWVSFAFKSLLDTVAAFAQYWGVGTPERMWTIEAIVMVFGLVSILGIREVQKRYPQEEAAAPEPVVLPAVGD